MRIAVFGANGRTGRRVVKQALNRDHSLVGFDRSFSDDFPDSAEKVEGDIHDRKRVSEVAEGCDAAISALGVTSESDSDIVSSGVSNIRAGMRENNVERLVVLTGAGAKLDDEKESPGGYLLNLLLRLVMPGVLEDGRRMVREIRDSELDWSVVRAPRLKDSKGHRNYETGTDLRPGLRGFAYRGDVADFMLELTETNSYKGEMPFIRS